LAVARILEAKVKERAYALFNKLRAANWPSRSKAIYNAILTSRQLALRALPVFALARAVPNVMKTL